VLSKIGFSHLALLASLWAEALCSRPRCLGPEPFGVAAGRPGAAWTELQGLCPTPLFQLLGNMPLLLFVFLCWARIATRAEAAAWFLPWPPHRLPRNASTRHQKPEQREKPGASSRRSRVEGTGGGVCAAQEWGGGQGTFEAVSARLASDL